MPKNKVKISLLLTNTLAPNKENINKKINKGQTLKIILFTLCLPNICQKFVNKPGITTKAIANLIPINIVKNAKDIAGKPIPDNPFTKPANKKIAEINNI